MFPSICSDSSNLCLLSALRYHRQTLCQPLMHIMDLNLVQYYNKISCKFECRIVNCSWDSSKTSFWQLVYTISFSLVHPPSAFFEIFELNTKAYSVLEILYLYTFDNLKPLKLFWFSLKVEPVKIYSISSVNSISSSSRTHIHGRSFSRKPQ